MRQVGAKQQVSAAKPRFCGLDTTPPNQAHLAAPETCCAKVVGFRESAGYSEEATGRGGAQETQ